MKQIGVCEVNSHLVCHNCLVECHECGDYLCRDCGIEVCFECGEWVCHQCSKQCHICENKCPTKAIKLNPWPVSKHKDCIKCLCCIEICPQKAVHLAEKWPINFLKIITNVR